MIRSVSAAALLAVAVFAVDVPAKSSGDKHKVKYKDVIALAKEPKTCDFLGKVDKDASGFMVFSGKQMRNKINKKLQKAVAKLGGNAYWVNDKMDAPGGVSYEAKAYWCDQLPPGSDDADKGEDKGAAADDK